MARPHPLSINPSLGVPGSSGAIITFGGQRPAMNTLGSVNLGSARQVWQLPPAPSMAPVVPEPASADPEAAEAEAEASAATVMVQTCSNHCWLAFTKGGELFFVDVVPCFFFFFGGGGETTKKQSNPTIRTLYKGIIIPGFLRCCWISSMHSSGGVDFNPNASPESTRLFLTRSIEMKGSFDAPEK